MGTVVNEMGYCMSESVRIMERVQVVNECVSNPTIANRDSALMSASTSVLMSAFISASMNPFILLSPVSALIKDVL